MLTLFELLAAGRLQYRIAALSTHWKIPEGYQKENENVSLERKIQFHPSSDCSDSCSLWTSPVQFCARTAIRSNVPAKKHNM